MGAGGSLDAFHHGGGRLDQFARGHALAQIELLEKQVAELLSKAEAADGAPLEDGLSLPEEIARWQDRLERLRTASEVIKTRAKERYQQELSQFQAKEQERVERAKKTGKKPGGRPPQPPWEGPGSFPSDSNTGAVLPYQSCKKTVFRKYKSL